MRAWPSYLLVVDLLGSLHELDGAHSLLGDFERTDCVLVERVVEEDKKAKQERRTLKDARDMLGNWD